jgi:hypothetical protein
VTDAERLARARKLYVDTVTRPEFEELTIATERRDYAAALGAVPHRIATRHATAAAVLEAARNRAGAIFDAEVNRP